MLKHTSSEVTEVTEVQILLPVIDQLVIRFWSQIAVVGYLFV